MSKKTKKNKPLEIDSEFSERNYTIVGALFSGSVAYLLFASQSAYQELELTELRLATLLVFAAILPFQGAYLIIHTYVQRYRTLLDEQKMITLTKLAELCRMIGYLSVLGFTLSLININLIIYDELSTTKLSMKCLLSVASALNLTLTSTIPCVFAESHCLRFKVK